MRRSLKYSSANTSSITTTFPSQGATTALLSTVKFLAGMRKKKKIKNNSTAVTKRSS